MTKDNGMVQPLGQKCVGGGKGAKEHNDFENARESGDVGSASLPKAEYPVCNTAKGQETK